VEWRGGLPAEEGGAREDGALTAAGKLGRCKGLPAMGIWFGEHYHLGSWERCKVEKVGMG
jgi:hypothetical protein